MGRHMVGIRIFPLQGVDQPMRQVLIEEQFHCAGNETSLRSRSAANSRQARISSRVRSGKSLRMSASLMPEARYSNTSYTVMRRPRMQGLPPRLAGSEERALCPGPYRSCRRSPGGGYRFGGLLNNRACEESAREALLS